MPAEDPRPLIGEPLSLDLLNTRWVEGGSERDLLTGVDGLAVWLASAGLAGRCTADGAALAAVRRAREVLAAAAADPTAHPEAVREGLNEVLAHGRVRRVMTPDGPCDEPETDDAAWLAAWLAVDDYLRLLRLDPARIRRCAHPKCVLHFFDTSQNRRRRWCSMAVCGNRAKASRHYARSRE